MENFINVFSEIGELKKVLLHRPGRELQRLIPQYLQRMLFDDIPYLAKAQEEHDQFAKILQSQGAEVLYLMDLLKETLSKSSVKEEFLEEFCSCFKYKLGTKRADFVKEYLSHLSLDDLMVALAAGVLKSEIPKAMEGLFNLRSTDLEDPFLVDPLPNLYFTRDPAASMGNGVSMSSMSMEARSQETLFLTYIFKYHPTISQHQIPLWNERTLETYIEGGDEIILSKDSLAIGISQRTHPNSVEKLALKLLNANNGYKKIYGIVIPSQREFMHLDTVFTMIDHDKFVVHPTVMEGEKLKIYCLELASKDNLKVTEIKDLKTMLKLVFNLNPIFIPCGGGNFIDAAREQWTDGSNTLCVKPGVVVTYSFNAFSNKAMEDHGIKVHSFYGAELVRGRGGPRCMSMPLFRKNI